MSTSGRMLEIILEKYNLLCSNEKEETWKSTIDLWLANLMIASEYKWSKEYKLGGSDHFPFIIEDESEVSTKQHQRWSLGRANWIQFQKESTITTKVLNQNTIEEAHSYLVKIILQATERTIFRDKWRPPVAWWNEESRI